MTVHRSYIQPYSQTKNGKTVNVQGFWRECNYVVTEEQRRKISETLTGRKLPEKTRKKMSNSQREWWKNADSLSKRKRYDAMTNLWQDENAEHRRQKFREAMRGDKNPAKRPEARRKISKALKGNQNGLGNKSHLGQKLSIEHKRKISEAEKGRVFSRSQREKMAKAQKDLWEDPQYSVQQSQRISRAMKKLWQGDEEFQQQQRAKMLKGLLKRPTSLEKQFIAICKKHELPFRYVGDGEFFIGSKNPDFIQISGKKVCVEVANTYHHSENYKQERKAYFSRFGWGCIVFKCNHLDEASVLSKLRGVD